MARLKLKNSVSPIVVLVWALVIILVGLLIIRQQNSSIEALEAEKEQLTMDYVMAQQESSNQNKEIARSNSRDYVTEIARQNGYQYPGDTYYVIINKELLYDSEEFTQEEQQ